MSPEGSPLDLNHLPGDFTRDHGKQVLEDDPSSSSGQRRKKSNENEESDKVYECRFCSLKFCKSQALGGHMNRHRQERETETLNKARQLVYSTDHQNIAAHPLPTLGSYVTPGSTTIYPPPPPQPPQVYPTRPLIYSGTGSMPHQQYPPHHHHQSCVYTSSVPPRSGGDYYMAHGHALTGSSHFYNDTGTNYTCIGAPVGLDREETGLWTRSYVTNSSLGSDHNQHHHHLDSPY